MRVTEIPIRRTRSSEEFYIFVDGEFLSCLARRNRTIETSPVRFTSTEVEVIVDLQFSVIEYTYTRPRISSCSRVAIDSETRRTPHARPSNGDKNRVDVVRCHL